MRVVAWQHATKQHGVGCDVARLRPGTDLAMTTAAHAAERSFGIHNYIERPWGPGGASGG
jgi:hypothetical protein